MPTPAELERAKKKWLKANRAYHSGDGKALMTDAEFDKLDDLLRKYCPEWGPLHSTGVIDAAKEDVVLPQFMPSLGKKYPDEIDAWLEQRQKLLTADADHILMDKLDGSALNLGLHKGRPAFLATRGDGATGGDISFLLPFMNIPKKIPYPGKNELNFDVHLRCEALMNKDVFEAKYTTAILGEKDGYKTARAAVAGILNSVGEKIDANKLHDIDIVVLGVYGYLLKPGLKLAQEWGYNTVHFVTRPLDQIDSASLDTLLMKRRAQSPYDLDGIVIAPAERTFEYKKNERPKWAIAFKRNADVESAAKATVKKIIWQLSHAGRWTPKILIAPVIIDGVEVKHATAHNAKWMEENGIGPGAVVRLLRSGEVIPKIVGVDKPAKTLSWPEGETKWKGKFLYSATVTATQKAKRIERFLERLGVEDIAEKNVILLHDAGINTITKMVRLACEEEKYAYNFLTRKVFMGEAKSKRLIEQFPKIIGADLRSFMLASSCFENVDASRFDLIESVVDLKTLIDMPAAGIRALLLPVKGFKDKTIDNVLEGLAAYAGLHARVQRLIPLKVKARPQSTGVSSGKWLGKTAVWTGYRDKAQEAEWAANGGKIASSVSKSLHVLFYRADGKASTKVDKARALGVRATTWEKFAE